MLRVGFIPGGLAVGIGVLGALGVVGLVGLVRGVLIGLGLEGCRGGEAGA